jgi:hypothetical protein
MRNPGTGACGRGIRESKIVHGPQHTNFLIFCKILSSGSAHIGLLDLTATKVIDSPDAWPGYRNPVRYGTLEEFGITDPEALAWHPMPAIPPRTYAGETLDEDQDGPGPLTIAEAKAGLALGLSVPEAAI